jgi:PII-like signaling protein
MASEMKYARVYINEGDKLLPLIMEYLHNDAQVSGATVVRAYSGFGKSKVVHSIELAHEANNLPLIIEFIDTVEKVDHVIRHFKDMFRLGHIVSWPVNVD